MSFQLRLIELKVAYELHIYDVLGEIIYNSF